MVGAYRVFDAHCHVFPDKIADAAVAGTDHFYGVTSFHDGRTATLLDSRKESGVDRCLIHSVATTPRQVRSINEFIAATVRESGGAFVGFGALHPDSADQAEDVRHLIELGLRGVKLHPDIQGFKIDDYRCLKIYELCEREGLPILMHTGDSRYDYSNPNRLLPVLEIYTGLTVIGAHLGGYSIWEEACERLAGTPNLFVDCSSSLPWLKPEDAVRIIRAYGADRVLFGSDYPMWSPKKELESFLALGLTEEENRAILWDNAEKLLKL